MIGKLKVINKHPLLFVKHNYVDDLLCQWMQVFALLKRYHVTSFITLQLISIWCKKSRASSPIMVCS